MVTFKFENAAGVEVFIKTDIIDHSAKTNWNFTNMEFVLPENNGTTITSRNEAEVVLANNIKTLGLVTLQLQTYNVADIRALAETWHLKITRFAVGDGAPETLIDCTDWSCSLSLEA